MSRVDDWQILVGRAASTMTQRRGDPASALEHGGNEPTDGLVFLGNVHETVPRTLLLDQRLGAVDVLGWQIIRVFCNADRTTAFPTYDELQPLLRGGIGSNASRGTVARVMAILRLTRWLSLSHRARHETNGRIIGNVYVLHDEPITPVEAIALDKEYLTLVEKSLRHSNSQVRNVAQVIHQELVNEGVFQEDTPPEVRPMARLNRRAQRFQEMQPAQKSPSSQSEPGQFAQDAPQFSERTKLKNKNLASSSQSELRQFPERTTPSSQSELSLESSTYRLVPRANSALTTVRSSTNNNYIRSSKGHAGSDGDDRQLFWSDRLELANVEKKQITYSLEVLPFDLQQAVLDETAGKVSAGKSSSPVGLLHTLIKRACEGRFRPTTFAQQQAERRGERYVQVSQEVQEAHSATTRPMPAPRSVQTNPATCSQPASSRELSEEEREKSKQEARTAREQILKTVGLKRGEIPPSLQ